MRPTLRLFQTEVFEGRRPIWLRSFLGVCSCWADCSRSALDQQKPKAGVEVEGEAAAAVAVEEGAEAVVIAAIAARVEDREGRAIRMGNVRGGGSDSFDWAHRNLLAASFRGRPQKRKNRHSGGFILGMRLTSLTLGTGHNG